MLDWMLEQMLDQLLDRMIDWMLDRILNWMLDRVSDQEWNNNRWKTTFQPEVDHYIHLMVNVE